MVKKKCFACNKKIDNKFSFCPHCGNPVKKNSGEDYGMLGKSDKSRNLQDNLKLPFGMEKIMNSLIKQLEKQMGSMDLNNIEGMPKNIKIRVARGNPGMNQVIKEKPRALLNKPKISEKENERRTGLPKVEVEAKVKRLSDSITYELETPGVKSKDDVELIELATGLEIRAYSKNKCYLKFIPLKLEIVDYHVRKEKVFVELKG